MPMVDIDWLKDHVEVPEGLTYEQLAKDLVKVGLEEEEIHTSQVTGPIVVGYVVDATPEPQKNGKIINWCHVDVGDEYNETDENGNKVPRGIICGAPNMAAGEKVVVTLPGAVLPGDFKIEPRKTNGRISLEQRVRGPGWRRTRSGKIDPEKSLSQVRWKQFCQRLPAVHRHKGARGTGP